MGALEWLNLKLELEVGPDRAAYDGPCGSAHEEQIAADLARLWRVHREDVLAEGTPGPDHWAFAVLEQGDPPPFEPDPRLEPGDPLQLAYQECAERLAAVARRAYRQEDE